MVLVCPARSLALLDPRQLITELFSTVLSVFAIVILSIIALLYRTGHEEFVGGQDDPEDGKAVAGTIFTAVIVYAVRNTEPQTPPSPFLPRYT